ncbi:MAG: nicotinate-nucleotide adenylyltransferase [Nitratireductor sp.]|nr:nicotinate-nucleotide adenylyltransferase [Nitratireductor sp.]
MPKAGDGLSVGLFGGSFNPPHDGHLHVSELVLARARLDRIWWIVTPGNPLKEHGNLAPLAERVAACRRIARHPRIDITAFEARFDTRYTADTLAILKRLRPRLRFVWIMGADNLGNFHHWQNWRAIADTLPMVVVDRPGATFTLTSAPAAIALSRFRIDEGDAALLPSMKPPVWTFVHGPRSALSSTRIRASKGNRGTGPASSGALGQG